MNKSLDRTEVKLLVLLHEIFQTLDEIERDHLSVLARGKGLELGHSLRRLQSLGLVEDIQCDPPYLLRLLGRLPFRVVKLTDKGRKAAQLLCDYSTPSNSLVEDRVK